MTSVNDQVKEKPDPRFNARIAIFNASDSHKLLSNYSVNLSAGGVFIEAVHLLPVDTSLVVKFKLPGDDAVITCTARVAWTNGPGELRKLSLPSGMGLQFLDLSLSDMHRIREYLGKGALAPTW